MTSNPKRPGRRVVRITPELVEVALETGLSPCEMMDPPPEIRLVDIRLRRGIRYFSSGAPLPKAMSAPDLIEVLVESAGWEDAVDATFDTAPLWNPVFRRTIE